MNNHRFTSKLATSEQLVNLDPVQGLHFSWKLFFLNLLFLYIYILSRTSSNCLFAFNFSKPVWGLRVKSPSQTQLLSQLSCTANFHQALKLVSSKLFPSNCNRIGAPSCFHMIDERLKGLLRLKAHLAPCWGPISCPCAGSRAATMQMRRSLQWMTIMWNGWEKVLETWQQGKASNHF